MTKSRDVQTTLTMMGMERGTTMLLIELFEMFATLQQQLNETALMQIQIIQMVEQVTDGAGAMRAHIERMQRNAAQETDEELPPLAT